MASYLNPHGVEVSAADAMIGGKLRSGFKEIIADGERISFDMLYMRDAKPKGDETSIDAALRETIATLAKGQGITAAGYLAKTPLLQLQKMAAEVASNVLETMSGQGVASKLADQRARRNRVYAQASLQRLRQFHRSGGPRQSHASDHSQWNDADRCNRASSQGPILLKPRSVMNAATKSIIKSREPK